MFIRFPDGQVVNSKNIGLIGKQAGSLNFNIYTTTGYGIVYLCGTIREWAWIQSQIATGLETLGAGETTFDIPLYYGCVPKMDNAVMDTTAAPSFPHTDGGTFIVTGSNFDQDAVFSVKDPGTGLPLVCNIVSRLGAFQVVLTVPPASVAGPANDLTVTNSNGNTNTIAGAIAFT